MTKGTSKSKKVRRGRGASAKRFTTKEATPPVPREPKVLFLDIEATGLNATFGVVLCIGWKWLGDPKVHCPSLLDRRKANMLDDRELIRQFVYEPYAEADYIVTWYGRRYDIPMLKARAIKHGMPPFPPIYHIDLWHEWRKQFKTHNNRLATVGEFLKLEHSKNSIDYEAWQLAALGDRASMEKVKDHCRPDVQVLEDAFLRVRPWLDCEPAPVTEAGELKCRACGSENLWVRAHKVTQAGRYVQYQCQDCGKYERAPSAIWRSPLRNTF